MRRTENVTELFLSFSLSDSVFSALPGYHPCPSQERWRQHWSQWDSARKKRTSFCAGLVTAGPEDAALAWGVERAMHSPGVAAPLESWRFFRAGYRASEKALNCVREDPSPNVTHCQPTLGPWARPLSVKPLPHCEIRMSRQARIWLLTGSQLCRQHTCTRE